MYKESWNDNLNDLKSKHKKIAEIINNRNVGIIDIPFYYNIGDHLIYQGTEAFFKNYNINVKYRALLNNISDEELNKCDVILFQGGGNFGDIYTHHQEVRERIINSFKSKTIICLPQTIYFEDDINLHKSINVFNKHKDFHFFVRDSRSLSIAEKFTNYAYLMPDMAHSLHPLIDIDEVVDVNEIVVKKLNMMRVDVEVSLNKIKTSNKRSFDWNDMITVEDIIFHTVINKTINLPVVKKRSFNYWLNKSEDLTFRAISYFYNFSEIHTDRLHGFILSLLLGKRIFLKDNSYGKNFDYYNEWIKENKIINKL